MSVARIAATGAAALIVFVALTGAQAMAKMCLFSEVEGTVLEQGMPVEGASIEREYRWSWKDETGKDSAVTDGSGTFRLPGVFRSSLLGSFLPHEPLIVQTILIRHAGKIYKAWLYDKRNYRENGELDGKRIKLNCHLEAPLKRSNNVYGICDLIG